MDQKPKKIDYIPIKKRGSYQQRIESVSEQQSSRVVDLRSILAKKEAQKKQEQRDWEEAKISKETTTERIVRDVTQEPNIIDSSSRLFVNTRSAMRDARARLSVRAQKLRARVPKRTPKNMSKEAEELEVSAVEPADTTQPQSPRQKKQRVLAVLAIVRRFRAATYDRLLLFVKNLTQPVSRALKNHLASLTEEQYATAKSIGSFLGVLCLVMIPLTLALVWGQVNAKQGQLTAQSEEAFSHIIAGQKTMQSLDFESASKEFGRGKAVLGSVDAELSGVNRVLLWIGQWIPGKGQQAYAASRLVRAGELLAGSAEQVSAQAQLIQTIQQQSPDELLPTIKTAAADLQPAAVDVHAAREIIDSIDPKDVPEEKRDQFATIQQLLPVADDVFTQGIQVTDAVLNLLGASGERRYIIVFQNNRELRPTGGFIGSLAIVKVQDGVITEFTAPGGGVYDIAGQLSESVISPTPLHLVNASWNLQDANWFQSFPDSAKKVQWFYERSNGATVDGVIAITPDLLESVMTVVGELSVVDDDKTVTVDADNIYSVLQARDDSDTKEGAKPKKIIGEITPLIMNRMIAAVQNPSDAGKLLQILQNALKQKDILLSVNDEQVQRILSAQKWTGEVLSAPKDYMYVNHANVAGGKTDQVIDETIEHTADIQSDGSIIDTVKITRFHSGDPASPLTSVKNNSYTRISVPKGSTILSAVGFDAPIASSFLTPAQDAKPDEDLERISGETLLNEQLRISTNEEYDKLVIGGWMITGVGESSTVTLQYRLPFKISGGTWLHPTDQYQLLVQKQPGLRDPYFVSTVRASDAFQVDSLHDSIGGSGEKSTVVLSTDFSRDLVLHKK